MIIPCANFYTVTSSSYVYSEYVDTDKYSLPSPVDIGLMTRMTMITLPVMLIIELIIILMMLLLLLAVIFAHEEQDELPVGMLFSCILLGACTSNFHCRQHTLIYIITDYT